MAIQIKRKHGQPTTDDLNELLEGQPLINLSNGDLYVGGCDKKIGQELVEAESVLRQQETDTLQSNIESEAALREQNDTDLQTAINTEKSVRQQNDTQLQNSINAEATTRQSKDNDLQAEINTEKGVREQKDTQLQNDINTEASTRQAKDNDLQTAINTEKSSRESADNELRTSIENEVTNREAAINSLHSIIEEDISATIEEEKSARQLFESSHNNIENGEGNSSLKQNTYVDNSKNPVSTGVGSLALGGYRGDKPTGTPNNLPKTYNPSLNYGSYTGIDDTTTLAAGVQSIAVGAGNRAYSAWDFVGGKDSTATGKGAFIFGGKNNAGVFTADANGKVGNDIYLYNATFGESNRNDGRSALVVGSSNTLNNFIYHKSSNDFVNGSIVSGRSNSVSGAAATIVGGIQNIIDAQVGNGHGSIVSGQLNYVSAPYAITNGTNNKNTKYCSLLVGINNINTNSTNGSIIGGSYNNNTTDALLELGNGDENGRSNAFEVIKDGSARLAKQLKIKETTVSPTDNSSHSLRLPAKNGTLAIAEDVYTKQEVYTKENVYTKTQTNEAILTAISNAITTTLNTPV